MDLSNLGIAYRALGRADSKLPPLDTRCHRKRVTASKWYSRTNVLFCDCPLCLVVATGLFERAHKLMLAAVGPDDAKTKAILRNLEN